MHKITTRELLHGLGFSTVEADTYYALLSLDSVSIRKVAELSGINRGTTYEAIKRLVNVGLVHSRRSGERDYYAAESPEKIYDLIREKRKSLMDVQRQAQEIIPELLAQQIRPLGRPLVRYYENDEGIAAILTDVLQTCVRLEMPEYRIYSARSLRQYLYRQFEQFTERRIQEGIAVKAIAIGKGGEPAPMAERKWLDESMADDTASYTLIYGDKVALISVSNDLTPYGVLIQDTGTATMQRIIFEQIWSKL